MRIVSLVPSLTELVFHFGRGADLVGRTRFCEAPSGEVEAVPIMGGTKNPKLDRILAARPDLIIANKEENRREDIEALREAGLDVLLTDPNTVDEALAMIFELGEVLDARDLATDLVTATGEALAGTEPGAGPCVLVPIWHEPLMALGSNTYGHNLLERCGATNVLRDRPRYPEVTREEVAALKPDLVLLPDEPFPFAAEHVPAYTEFAPARVIDGKNLWWYGCRMPGAIAELRRILREGA